MIYNSIAARNYVRMRAVGNGEPGAFHAVMHYPGRGRGGRGRGRGGHMRGSFYHPYGHFY
jgi:hypothetical protein